MTRDERRRIVQRRLRETDQRLFDLQGDAIAGLREALEALSRTPDEMTLLFKADNDLDDLTNEEGRA